MNKKLIGIGIGLGIALLVSPVIASAQTASSGSPSLIASLEQLVATLTQELEQLIAVKSSSQITSTPTQNTGVSSNSFANLCASYAHLTKGNTDASTGGEVSQLQSFVGISPTTGYYGAQTSIAYQNKCGNLGNSQPTSVAGMSQYTDSSFGFSFWYPSGWSVQQTPVTYPDVYGGGTISKEYMVTGPGHQILVSEFTSNAQSITVPSGPCGYCEEVVFAFDGTQGVWTRTTPNGPDGDPDATESEISEASLPQPADVSKNTMGGLHVFQSEQKDSVVIIPLSASKFIIVDDLTADQDDFQPAWSFVNTIVATNPAVAIPVSTSQQAVTIQAEANAYGVQTGNTTSPSSQTYTNSQYGFSMQYPAGFTLQTDPDLISSGMGTDVARVKISSGNEDLKVITDPSAQSVASCMNTAGSQGNITIGGVIFQVISHSSSWDEDKDYSTVHNGICYYITESNTGTSASQNDTSLIDPVVQSFRFTQ